MEKAVGVRSGRGVALAGNHSITSVGVSEGVGVMVGVRIVGVGVKSARMRMDAHPEQKKKQKARLIPRNGCFRILILHVGDGDAIAAF